MESFFKGAHIFKSAVIKKENYNRDIATKEIKEHDDKEKYSAYGAEECSENTDLECSIQYLGKPDLKRILETLEEGQGSPIRDADFGLSQSKMKFSASPYPNHEAGPLVEPRVWVPRLKTIPRPEDVGKAPSVEAKATKCRCKKNKCYHVKHTKVMPSSTYFGSECLGRILQPKQEREDPCLSLDDFPPLG